jgi:hypothetical protein
MGLLNDVFRFVGGMMTLGQRAYSKVYASSMKTTTNALDCYDEPPALPFIISISFMVFLT